MTEDSKNRICVLYAEDEEVLRDVVSAYLEEVGDYEVRCGVNGQDGVDLAISWQPDFILMDVRMPIMNGIEAIRILRADPKTCHIPIYTLTAYSDNKTLAECEEAGADGHFSKPPNYKNIISIIKEVVKKKKSDAPTSPVE